MEMNGKMIICDHCGEKVFLKTIGDGETDGGFTRWNKFEPKPDGWERPSFDIGLLCPKCSAEYHEILRNFKHPTTKVEKEG